MKNTAAAAAAAGVAAGVAWDTWAAADAEIGRAHV